MLGDNHKPTGKEQYVDLNGEKMWWKRCSGCGGWFEKTFLGWAHKDSKLPGR